MSRYIDADALMQNWLFRGKDGKPYRDEIDTMPTADVVEVVRCKDCENWDTHWTSSTFKPNAHYCCVLDNAFDGEFFCACGERRKKIEV